MNQSLTSNRLLFLKDLSLLCNMCYDLQYQLNLWGEASIASEDERSEQRRSKRA